ncbi:outer membrane protein assembly factor [Polaribacter sp. Asnod1-A03]|uniref:outer membrane protein assembly factor n=1 Tax=Polaribacter sp. Asnod1-A03 TaxID=3160581 RepID=UPI00386C8029
MFFIFLAFSSLLFSQEKTIVDVKIKGLKKTKVSFIKSLILTQKGQVLDSLALEKDIITLKRLAGVSHAYYQVYHSHQNNYNVFIHVEENFTILPEVNLWTTTNQQFSYKLGLYDYNFLGRNIVFGGFYQNNGFDSYGINFKAPNLFSKKWGLSLTHQNWKSNEPLYFRERTANYLYNNISFEVLGLYQINLKNQLNFGVNFFNEKYKYLTGFTSPSIPQNLDLDKMLVKLVYSYDDLNYFYQYIDGFKSILYTQFVTSKNPFQKDFLIAWNDFFFYKTIKNTGTFANRLRVGFASNEDSPFAPFAIDNNVNIRGVGILVDRGTAVAVLNSEYRKTVYDKNWLVIQSNFFVDAGTWRNPGGELNDFLKRENLKVYSGIGLRFISKKIYNATFRIDYGFRIVDKLGASKGGLVFGLSQYF